MLFGTSLMSDISPGISCPLDCFGTEPVYWLRVLDMAEQYWFNTKTKQVEKGPQSLSLDRLGPFESFEEATRAEQIVADRARKILEDEARDDWRT